MIKYGIITPTFSGHFQFIKIYLQSFCHYVEDKQNINIYFTINRDENKRFQQIIAPFRNECNIKTLFFDEILLENHIYLNPDNLLKKYGKFSFQTLKKFYTMLSIKDVDKFLVLDSETSWVRKTNMQRLFENFFASPKCFYSHIDRNRLSTFTSNVQENINYISKKKCNYWFLENFMWYYDKHILLDMFQQYGKPIEIVDDVYSNAHRAEGVFEILLYQNYIYNHYDKYGYKLIDINQNCKRYLSPYVWENYYFTLTDRLAGNFGVLEQTMRFLTDQNTIEFANLFKRLGFNIIRCETGKKNQNQIDFFNIVQPNIFAASQYHEFGILSVSKTKLFGKFNIFSINTLRRFSREPIKAFLIKVLPSYKVSSENRDLIYENQRLVNRVIELENKIIAMLQERKHSGEISK